MRSARIRYTIDEYGKHGFPVSELRHEVRHDPRCVLPVAVLAANLACTERWAGPVSRITGVSHGAVGDCSALLASLLGAFNCISDSSSSRNGAGIKPWRRRSEIWCGPMTTSPMSSDRTFPTRGPSTRSGFRVQPCDRSSPAPRGDVTLDNHEHKKEQQMSSANVILYVALIAYVLYGKARGWPMKAPKKLFALPIVIVVIGFGDATQGTIKPVEIVLIGVGSVVSLVLGLMRGQADRISIRNGGQYVQWGALSFGLFAANIMVKVILDAIGLAAGMSFSTVGQSLVFTLGLTLVGEAIVLFVRSGGTADLLNTTRSGALRR